MLAIKSSKDVVGYHHKFNHIGRLLGMSKRVPLSFPCKPKRCLELLHEGKFSLKELEAAVVSQSLFGALPVAMLLKVIFHLSNVNDFFV